MSLISIRNKQQSGVYLLWKSTKKREHTFSGMSGRIIANYSIAEVNGCQWRMWWAEAIQRKITTV